MLEWNGVDPHLVDSVLERVRGGVTTVLVLEGEAGLGKTTFLADLVGRAEDFQVRHADGLQNDQAPFALLTQWGVEPGPVFDGGEASPRMAALGLRDRLDALAAGGPVLLVADDLQWADPESVDSLLWLLRRTAGDLLLVVIGTRPLSPEQHPDWQRWIDGSGAAVRITLRGLTRQQVAGIARRRWPSVSDELAEHLYEHTGGNPLYLKTLLAEHDLADLSTDGVLPAPAAFARSIAVRTGRLSDGALTLLRAAAVLGSTWSPLALVAAVAGVGEPTGFAQELRAAGLVDLWRLDEPLQLRPSHALVRAAVYQQTPLTQLRELHLQAASRVSSRASTLQHRRAAAAQYDDALADELEAYAHDLYGQRSFRQAAQYLRWASALTAEPTMREERWLESLYNLVLSYDFATLRAELDDVRVADDVVWRALVLGRFAIQERRYRDAVAHLEPITSGPLETSDPRLRYRAEVLLAWARACLGHPIDEIAPGIERARLIRPDHDDDGAIDGLELIVGSQVSIRRHGIGAVLTQMSTLPPATAVPLSATGSLAFRGSLRARMGLTREASDDLTEATRRIDGFTDFGAGSFHAQLGFVQWLQGDWGRARVSSRKAFDIAGHVVHQLTAAIAPLVDSSTGQFAEADALIESARELLTESPWEPACMQFTTTLLVRAHASGSTTQQATALAGLRGTPFDITDISRAAPALLLNYVPALIWAKRLDEADTAVVTLAHAEPAPDWASAAVSWFGGLIHEARGDGPKALASLTDSVAKDFDLPLYRAHLLADHARLARLLGRRPESDSSLLEAEAIYDRLGAVPYAERIRAIRWAPPTVAPTLAGGVTLTEREQDVLTLLLRGMSYAQISRELFITQSTVGYHLGNIYGKAGVTSRHELSDLARENPHLFGVTVGPA